jgi:ketosteroid isomerase-like protein
MRTTTFALGLTLLVAAPAAATAAPSGKEKEVLASMDAWKAAMMKKDRAAFDKVYHPDLSYGHSSGVVETKAEAIQHVLGGKGTYTAINFTDTKVRVHGNTAFVTGKVDYLERVEAKENPVHMVVLSVWTKAPSGWQMIARQSTKPPAPTAPGATAAAPAPAPAPAKK